MMMSCYRGGSLFLGVQGDAVQRQVDLCTEEGQHESTINEGVRERIERGQNPSLNQALERDWL